MAVALALLAALTVSACMDTSGTDAALRRADARLAGNDQVDKRVVILLGRAAEVTLTAEGAKRAIPLIDAASSELDSGKRSLAQARSEFGAVAAMDAPDQVRTYASEQIAAIDARRRLGDALGSMLADMRTLMGMMASGAGSEAETTILSDAIEAKRAGLGRLDAEVRALETQARDYRRNVR